MSRDGSTVLFFGDGEHKFRLGFNELIELQDLTGYGAEALLHRLNSTQSRVQDAREVLRIGLVGGGMTPEMAAARVKRYVEQVPDHMSNRLRAFAVLAESLQGPEEDSPEKKTPKKPKKKTRSLTDDGGLPPSTT